MTLRIIEEKKFLENVRPTYLKGDSLVRYQRVVEVFRRLAQKVKPGDIVKEKYD